MFNGTYRPISSDLESSSRTDQRREEGFYLSSAQFMTPLGFVAPFILNAKLILQDLCRKKLDWDDVIPEDIMRRWQAWLQELPKLEQVAIDRCFKPPNFGEVSST